jgi:DNA-binding transcriptional LysR family regulator
MTDMLAAALGGAGIALMPCLFGDGEPTLRRLSGMLTQRPMVLVSRKEARLNDGVRAVARFVVEVMRENAARFGGD